MYKFISNILIIGTIGLLIITVAKPELANSVTDKVLGVFVATDTAGASQSSSTTAKAQSLIPSTVSSYLRSIKSVPKSGETTTPVADTDDVALSTNNIIDATNRERINAGLPPLTMNTKLVASAKIKTEDLIAKQYFEHISPTGQSVSDLGAKVGYNYVIMGENLALGNFIDGNDVVQAWMNSPGHRANILNTNYQEIGVYAAKGMYQGREVWFAVQHFGTTRNACPAISTSLKASIDTINADLKGRQAAIVLEKEILESPNRPIGAEYKARVADFNAMVAEYNTALVISQEKIKTYNAQVAAFNTCLARYQAK